MRTSSLSRDLACTLGALLLLLLWEWAGQDMALAAWFGTPAGFAMHNAVWFDAIFHRWPHHLAWVVLFVLIAQIWWPIGFFKTLPRRNLVSGTVSIMLAILLIQVFKRASPTSCPWDLSTFGGAAQHLPHWRALLLRWNDGGGGHCFPAGGASSGFAFLAAYPFFRPHAPRLARYTLIAALVAGFIIGIAQQVRGAHFMSHTLWTAWLCWSSGLLLFYGQAAVASYRRKKTASAEAVG